MRESEWSEFVVAAPFALLSQPIRNVNTNTQQQYDDDDADHGPPVMNIGDRRDHKVP